MIGRTESAHYRRLIDGDASESLDCAPATTKLAMGFGFRYSLLSIRHCETHTGRRGLMKGSPREDGSGVSNDAEEEPEESRRRRSAVWTINHLHVVLVFRTEIYPSRNKSRDSESSETRKLHTLDGGVPIVGGEVWDVLLPFLASCISMAPCANREGSRISAA